MSFSAGGQHGKNHDCDYCRQFLADNPESHNAIIPWWSWGSRSRLSTSCSLFCPKFFSIDFFLSLLKSTLIVLSLTALYVKLEKDASETMKGERSRAYQLSLICINLQSCVMWWMKTLRYSLNAKLQSTSIFFLSFCNPCHAGLNLDISYLLQPCLIR
jgi:hypothetical protein